MTLRSLLCVGFLTAGAVNQACIAADPVAPPATLPVPSIPALKYRSVDVHEFEALRKKPNTVILDVRTPEEFSKGHIDGATNLDVMAQDFRTRAGSLDKSKTYLVNCAAGVRSARACKLMSELDIPALINLKGGYNAWVKETAGGTPKSEAK